MKTSGYGFFATLKEAVTLSDSRRGVISIKPGKSTGRDERHAVAMTKEGNLMIWDCFRTGQSHLLLEENLRGVMLDSISALYSTANTTFAVHDVEYHNILDYIYVLGSVDNTQAAKEVAYFLFTFAIKQNVLTLITTNQFKTITSSSSCRPRLLLPKPYTTLFASFSNAVILTDAAQNLLTNQTIHFGGKIPSSFCLSWSIRLWRRRFDRKQQKVLIPWCCRNHKASRSFENWKICR